MRTKPILVEAGRLFGLKRHLMNFSAHHGVELVITNHDKRLLFETMTFYVEGCKEGVDGFIRTWNHFARENS